MGREQGNGACEGEAGGEIEAGRQGESQSAKAARKSAKPIELYYWPTPNGFKISIMLEECGLPYTMIPVNISKGEQFKPDFLKISPNNRMPAIVDPDGPGGRPISIFESGAILQYLGRKTGKFYPSDERARVEVEQWLFWQMGGIGPMAGQVHHFSNYAVETLTYAINRYVNEVNRLYGVMNIAAQGPRIPRRQIFHRRHGDASAGPMAGSGRARTSNEFPHLKRWLETVKARPAVKRGMTLGLELRQGIDMKDPKVQAVLFGQRARSA